MHNRQLGIAPAIPIIAKVLPSVFSFFGGRDKDEAAKRAAQYEMAAQQIAAGQAVMATDVMTESDKAFLRSVWPTIRVAASFDHPNWAAHGYPNGPALTPAAKVAITHVWPEVRAAAKFDDVNWQYHAVPIDLVAKLMPVPELGYQQPGAQNVIQRGQPLTASMFPGLTSDTVMIGAIAAVVGLILFTNRR